MHLNVNAGKNVGHRHTSRDEKCHRTGWGPLRDPKFDLLFNARTTNAMLMSTTVSRWAFGYFLVCYFRLKACARKLTGNFADAGFLSYSLMSVRSIRWLQLESRSFSSPRPTMPRSLAMDSAGLITGMGMLLPRKLLVHARRRISNTAWKHVHLISSYYGISFLSLR